jgi:ubiquinone/menaquinone biosynthesis C-methylase UbiE
MHVGMNIDDKVQLFNEIYRVLRPGASFGVYNALWLTSVEAIG